MYSGLEVIHQLVADGQPGFIQAIFHPAYSCWPWSALKCGSMEYKTGRNGGCTPLDPNQPMMEHRMAIPSIPPRIDLSQLPRTTVTGIYFLWDGDRVVYVGQSKTIGWRIMQHLGDAAKKFDGISFLRCRLGSLNSWERQYIEGLLPRYNRCCLSKKLRRLKKLGMKLPEIEYRKPFNGKDVAGFLGVTAEQFAWLRSQPDPPKPIRIPRANYRRWVRGAVEKWAARNADLLEQAKAMSF